MTKDKIKLYGSLFIVAAYILWRFFIKSYPIEEFASEVISEKVLCINSGACTQEIYFLDHDGRKTAVSKRGEPWYQVGDQIFLLRQQDSNQRARSRRRHGPRYDYWLPEANI
jgi:hypothetical protein